MKTVKTSELIGVVLDWAVAKCEGKEKLFIHIRNMPGSAKELIRDQLCFSSDWAQGGPIIEREKIELYWHTQLECWATKSSGNLRYGPSSLIAAMRCFVASKFGDTVEIPEELL